MTPKNKNHSQRLDNSRQAIPKGIRQKQTSGSDKNPDEEMINEIPLIKDIRREITRAEINLGSYYFGYETKEQRNIKDRLDALRRHLNVARDSVKQYKELKQEETKAKVEKMKKDINEEITETNNNFVRVGLNKARQIINQIFKETSEEK